jgi:hypothetical protein
MSVAVVIALIALAGSILSTVATVFGSPALQGRREARETLESYREPLLAAAYELQARLHNILRNRFIENYLVGNKADKKHAALQSTLYVFAQYFGWREIIRREVQLLRFSRDTQTREIARLLRDVSETFLTDAFGPQFMIWRVEQRGFGEQMMVTTDGKMRCLGYAAFIEQRTKMQQWLDPLEHDLQSIEVGGRNRLTELQHLLLDLVRRLDEERTRYPFEMDKA